MYVSVNLCVYYERLEVSIVGSLNAALSFRPRLGCVCFLLLGRPVGDLPALQHRPPVPLHVVEQRDDDACAHQQLGGQQQHKDSVHNTALYFPSHILLLS